MTAYARAQARSEAAAVPVRVLQRACACGEAAGVSGKCPACAAEERLGVQPKLTINRPGDRWEREADRIADEVVSDRRPALAGPLPVTPLVQRQEADEEEDEEKEKDAQVSSLQRRSAQAIPDAGREHRHQSGRDEVAPPLVHEVLGGPGQPLDPGTRALVEPRLGYDFGAVRVHTGAKAAASTRAVGAQAYTVGRDIVFDASRYAPATAEGKRLLVHELVHVVQQDAALPLHRAATSPSALTRLPAAPQAGRSTVTPGSYGIRLALPSGDKWILPPSISDLERPSEVGGSTVAAASGGGPKGSRILPSAAARIMLASRVDKRLQRRASFTNPTPTAEDPLARLAAGGTPGLTTPTINAAVVSDANQVLQQISPTRVSGTMSGGTASCQFDPAFTIDTSANVIVASPPGGAGWTGSMTVAALGSPPACSGVGGNVPVTMVATPSNADFVARVRASEQEHVDSIRELHDRHFVPFDAFVTGLRGTGPSLADCGQNLVAQLGNRVTQATFGFVLGYAAETQRLDGPGGTHEDVAVPTPSAGCSSITLTVSPRTAPIPGASRGNVVRVAPTVVTYDCFLLSVSGNDVVETSGAAAGGRPPPTRVIHRFSSPAAARVGLHVFLHYGTTSKNTIGAMTYLLVDGGAPAGTGAALNGVTEETLDPALFQVTFGVPGAGDWAVSQVDGNNVRMIINFGNKRNEAYSAVEVLRSLGVTKFAYIGSRASPELMFFRL